MTKTKTWRKFKQSVLVSTSKQTSQDQIEKPATKQDVKMWYQKNVTLSCGVFIWILFFCSPSATEQYLHLKILKHFGVWEKCSLVTVLHTYAKRVCWKEMSVVVADLNRLAPSTSEKCTRMYTWWWIELNGENLPNDAPILLISK